MVSIVMPVYNGEPYIQECMDSILQQTYQDFEVVIVDDCSADHSFEILREYERKDSRIRVLANSSHDMIKALNYGMEQAKGEYIARMDIDDVMLPNRLEKQVEVMAENKDITVCASWLQTFGLVEQVGRGGQGCVQFPLFHLLRNNFIAHPTTMLKTSFLKMHNLKYREYPYAEDYKLWMDIAVCGGTFWIIPAVLLKYRISEHQVSSTKSGIQSTTANEIRNEILNFLLDKGDFPDDKMNIILTYLGKYNQAGYVSDNTIFDLCAEILLSYYEKRAEI